MSRKPKRRMKVEYLPTSSESREIWEKLCPPNSFAVYLPRDLPAVIPPGLSEKYDSVLVTCSGLCNDSVLFYMLNGNRIDQNEIDQMPFGLAFLGSETVPSGILLQHGGWKNRTTAIPDAFTAYLDAELLGRCFPLPELPKEKEGKLEQLQIESQRNAFSIVIDLLKKLMKL